MNPKPEPHPPVAPADALAAELIAERKAAGAERERWFNALLDAYDPDETPIITSLDRLDIGKPGFPLR